jgi:hypothetical protein
MESQVTTDAFEQPITSTKWCGICGKHVAKGEILPCAIQETTTGLKIKETDPDCPLLTKAPTIPLSPKGVEELLDRPEPAPVAHTSVADTLPPATVAVAKSRPSVLEEAFEVTNGSRRGAYGTPERNFERIRDLWNTYLALRFEELAESIDLPILEVRDIPAMMRLVKEARLIETPNHRDSFVDIAGYARCQAEIEGVDR